jgi:hypothetical protein
LLELEDKTFGIEFPLQGEDVANLKRLSDRLKACADVLRPFLHKSTAGLKLLLFDVETNEADRDDVRLVGVLVYPDLKIFHYDHRLTKGELETLVDGASIVIFAAFNARFDLPRLFDDSAAPVLLKRVTKIGQQQSAYYVYKSERGESVGYSLDIMRLANNVLDNTKWSLWEQTRSNKFFQKLETEDYLHLEYNAWDLLSEFELLVRAAEGAAELMRTLDFSSSTIIDFILRQFRFEPLESHMSPLKLFEVGSRLAKALVAPYARFPSLPAVYMGGRVEAWKVGRFSKFAFLDINSQYPAIMSRLSPNTMKLVWGDDAVALANSAVDLIHEYGSVEAFRRLYVEQDNPALLLSAWILVQFKEDGLWHVEVLKEKGKKSQKLSPYTLIYRNRRAEQTRTEGFVRFKAGDVYQLPFYLLFLQSVTQLKRIKIVDAAGLAVSRDVEWTALWERMYRMRREHPALSNSLKIMLNSVTGLLGDVDQQSSNMAIGAHVTAFSRVVSHLVEAKLGDALLYHDTDGYAVDAAEETRLRSLLDNLSPWGCKKEYDGAEELVIMRTKRYAVRMPGGTWITKGAERAGFGREKNRMLSFLKQAERLPEDDIRQVTKERRTPQIPAVKDVLKRSESGEWCYYFSYPLPQGAATRLRDRLWFDALETFFEELESGGSGESLEYSLNSQIRRVAEWAGFVKKPSKNMPKSLWCLEFFEYLRAYGYTSRKEIYELVRRKAGIDLEAVSASLMVDEYAGKEERIIMDYAGEEAKVRYDITKSRRIYFACKLKEPLIDLARKLTPLSPANLRFQSSEVEEGIPAKVFAPLLGKPDTTCLEAQISLASLLHLPVETREKMQLLAKAIGAMGLSDNYGVKLAVETLRVHKGELRESNPYLVELPRRARKRSPFSQRRFYLIQSFPYKVRYFIGADAVTGAQFANRKFIAYGQPAWLMRSLVEIISTFFKDVKLLEARLNVAFQDAIKTSRNILLRWVGQDLKLHVVPYARYLRFDVAYDMPRSQVKGLIEKFEDICDRNDYDYRKGLGFIGLNGRVLTNSRYFVPGNIVLYDRSRRFNAKTNNFLRKYKPFVEAWQNDDLGRLEIQTFAHRSNNRRANPLASLLNVLEMFKLRAPDVFRFVDDLLSVITNMFRDLPERSGFGGLKGLASAPEQSTQVDSRLRGSHVVLAGLGLGPPDPGGCEEDA